MGSCHYHFPLVHIQVAVCPSQNPSDVAPVVIDSAGDGIVKIITSSSWYVCACMGECVGECMRVQPTYICI